MHVKLTDFMLRIDELTSKLSVDPLTVVMCISDGTNYAINRYRNVVQYELNNRTYDIDHTRINLAGKSNSWRHFASSGFSIDDIYLNIRLEHPLIVLNESTYEHLVPIFICNGYYDKLVSLGSPRYSIDDPVTNFNIRHMLDTMELSGNMNVPI